MKNLLYLFLGLALFSCKDDSTENNPLGDEDKEMIELRNQVEQLKLDNRMKDSVLNESLAFFNEIQENLAIINVKQEQIRIRSTNPEISNDDKEWVLQEIQNINFLREENARKVRSLQKQAKKDALQISQLQATIDRLVLQIQSQDERIESLQNQLANLDMEYSELFDQYQEQVELALDVIKEMNEVHYAYGTLEELMANKVLVKEGGFIGIGKKTTIADDMNQEYFQHLDKTKTKQITIIGEKPQIMTDHPASSYEWQGNKLVIKDVNAFWRISNYLVVTVK
jgi:hypothetical protein